MRRSWLLVGLLAMSVGLVTAQETEAPGNRELQDSTLNPLPIELLMRRRGDDRRDRRDSPRVLELVRPMAESTASFIANVVVDGKPVTLATIVGDGGWAITKASEIPEGRLRVRLSDRRLFDARIVASRRSDDLAMLRFDAEDAKGVKFAEQEPPIGSFLISVGTNGSVLGIGIVGDEARGIAEDGKLGVRFPMSSLSTSAAYVDDVVPGSGAAAAGLRKGDVVISADGNPIPNRETLAKLVDQMYPGDRIKLDVQRGTEKISVAVEIREFQLMQESETDARVHGNRSNRAGGFSRVLHHDTVIEPNECGGLVLNLQGKPVGINIARANRVSSYAIPAPALVPIIKSLMPTL